MTEFEENPFERVQVDSLALPGTPEYAVTTEFIRGTTEKQIIALEQDIASFGLQNTIRINGSELSFSDIYRQIRDSDIGQAMGRMSRWRHHMGGLTPDQHLDMLGYDARILFHSMENCRGWVELAGIQRTGLSGGLDSNGLDINNRLLAIGMFAELTHDTPEATVEDWPSFSKNSVRSMVEQMLHVDVLHELFGRDDELFVTVMRILDKRGLGGLDNDSLLEAEKMYHELTGQDPGYRAKVIREAIGSRGPFEAQGADIHALVEQKTYFRTAQRAWHSAYTADQLGGYKLVDSNLFRKHHAALALSVLTNYIGRLTDSANRYTHFRMMLWENRDWVNEVFQADPEIMRIMLDYPAEVLGDPHAAAIDIERQIADFPNAVQVWRNFRPPRPAKDFSFEQQQFLRVIF